LGRDEPKRRRAHLYAVIQETVTAESQGCSEKDADIQRLCALSGLSRAGCCRRLAPKAAKRDDADLSDLIQRVALEDRHCGDRRIAD